MDPAALKGDEPALVPGEVGAEVADELPGLALLSTTVRADPAAHSTDSVRERLRYLADRFGGPQALALRRQPIPAAYRAFHRQVGLDPDADRTPLEAAALERLTHGGFRSRRRLDDALLIALVETGVPLWALDAGAVHGGLRLRAAVGEEGFGHGAGAPRVAPGRLVIADDRGPVAVLLGEVAPGHGVTPDTTEVTLFCLRVPGVPAIHVEEALWVCTSVLAES